MASWLTLLIWGNIQVHGLYDPALIKYKLQNFKDAVTIIWNHTLLS